MAELTLKAVRIALRVVGVAVTYTDDLGEYRVNFIGAREATAYYTDDLEDALLTGLIMATLRKKQQNGRKGSR